MIITFENLLGPHAGEPWTEEELDNGRRTVATWNVLEAAASADGVPLSENPATKSPIGGNGNGGARPHGSKVGAPGSTHQVLLALDRYDPTREFMKWLLSYGLERAAALGMYFEHPQWTRSWVHGQIIAPGDHLARWNIFFIPYADIAANPPTCIALPEQELAVVHEYPFGAVA